ncbi:MAG: hypothetical protein MJ252_08165, partial [archaeon]|nr:hypothetical protein [archaeon]
MYNLYDEISQLKSDIYSLKQKKDSSNRLISKSFAKDRKWSLRGDNEYNNYSNYFDDSPYKKQNQIGKSIHSFKPTLLITVIKYLDIKTILVLSLVNKEFYYFTHSIYFYMFITQMRQRKEKLNTGRINKDNFTPKKEKIERKPQSENKSSSFFSKLTGAITYLAPVTNFNLGFTERANLEQIQQKIKIHEKLLKEKILHIKISEEVNEIRKKINVIVDQKMKKNYGDKEIEKIKRE